MADVVKFGADATDYFDVVARMQSAHERLSGSIGNPKGFDGFLQGEYRVTHQAKFLTQSLPDALRASSKLCRPVCKPRFFPVASLSV